MFELGQGTPAPAADDLIMDVSEADFMDKVVQASMTTPVIVDFWAPWCGPCRMMAPEFGKAAAELKGAARLVKLNTEDHPQAGQTYGIRGIPTMIRFQNGREARRQSGAMRSDAIVAWAR